MKTIVVSAVNLKVGGTLTILRDCLHYLSVLAQKDEFRIVALVYNKELALYPCIEYIEMRWPKKSWFNRLWCEYLFMRRVSRGLSPVHLWFSLHDTTPNVVAERRAVYCHNPFPFYKWKIRECFFAPKIVLFALFSKYAYRVNIHKNSYVVVQQQWLKDEFLRLFGLNATSIIVAPPAIPTTAVLPPGETVKKKRCSFIYASSANSHKNFECLCRAAEILRQDIPAETTDIFITVAGNENRYARWLFKKWGRGIPALHFVGFLDRQTLYGYYRRCDCLIFPSKVETWGLPVSEFAITGKPMLLADLPYAHETAGGTRQVAFFNPEKPEELAGYMRRLIKGDTSFLRPVDSMRITTPSAGSWEELFKKLLQ